MDRRSPAATEIGKFRCDAQPYFGSDRHSVTIGRLSKAPVVPRAAMNCVGVIPQPVEVCPQLEIAESTTTIMMISSIVIIPLLRGWFAILTLGEVVGYERR